ncbi:MAG: hypothetical protein ACRDKI_08085 [Solirubrobacterales bacterium]
MRLRGKLAVLVAVYVLCAWAAAAQAHQSNPNYSSVFRAVVPAAPGLKVQILGGDDRVELLNESGKDVIVSGYDKEPYIWIKAGGDVLVNQNSPATYLNEDRYAAVKVPPNASADAHPSWKLEAGNGRIDWHDHRVHWMSKVPPSKVLDDPSRRTKVFDWQVPVAIDGRPGSLDGTLFWQPPGTNSPTAPAAFVFSAFVLLMVIVGGVLMLRRHRKKAEPIEDREAW